MKAENKRFGEIRRGLLAVFVVSAVAPPASAASEPPDGTLDALRQAHRAAVQALRTVSCDVKEEDGPPDRLKTITTGRYARSGDRVRITYQTASTGHIEEVLITKSEVRSFGKEAPEKGGAVTGASRRPASEAIASCDVWRSMLLTFPSGHREWLTLDQLVQRSKTPARAKKVVENGKAYVQLSVTLEDMSHRENRFDVWFDPAVNYLARKAETLIPKVGRVRFDVLDFVEAKPGVFMPRETTVTLEYGPARRSRFTLSNLKVNEPIPEETFELTSPAGTPIFDSIADLEGNTAGPPRAQTMAQGSHITVGPNVLVSKSRPSQSHREVVIAAHPSDPAQLVAASMTERGKGSGINVVAYRSCDGGLTWEFAFENPNPAPGAFGRPATSDSWGDPAVAHGPDGALYFAAIYMGPGADELPQIVFARSLDGGKTFEASTVAARLPDRPFLAVDGTDGKSRGTICCDFACPDSDTKRRGLALSISRDAGRTFSPPRVWRVEESATRFSMTPGPSAVLSDGTLVVPYCHRPEPSGKKQVTICVRRSNTGSESFSDERSVSTHDYYRPYYSNMPLLAADPGSQPYKDRLYLAWSQRTADGQRIFLAVSSDKGLTWSKPMILSDESDEKNYDAVLPAVAVNNKGVVGVSWYDSRPGPDGKPTMNVRFGGSVDGGTTWLPIVCITEVPSPISFRVSTPQYEVPVDFLGDTAGLAADAAGDFHPLWVDNRSGVLQVYTAKVSVREGGGDK